MIHICITQGVDKGEQIKTRQAVVSIGRSSRCDLVLHDNKVSHLHGEFLFVGSRCIYRDLLSHNGSFVRSKGKTYWLGPLKSEREVKADDEIILGNTAILLEEVLPEGIRVSERHEDDFLGTMAVDANHLGRSEEQLLAIAEVAQFQEFLDLPSHDATSVKETKAAICDALIIVLPDAACVTIVDLRPGPFGELTVDRLDVANVVSVSRGNGERAVDPHYSFRILPQNIQPSRPGVLREPDGSAGRPEHSAGHDALLPVSASLARRRDGRVPARLHHCRAGTAFYAA